MMSKWGLHERTTEEQARINRGRSDDGKIPTVEDTAPSDDDWDVAIGLAGSGVVHGTTGPNKSTSSTCQCGDGSNDGCVCGMDGT